MANPRRRRQAKMRRLAQMKEAAAPAVAPTVATPAATKEPAPIAAPKTAAPSPADPAKKTTRTRKSIATSKTTKK